MKRVIGMIGSRGEESCPRLFAICFCPRCLENSSLLIFHGLKNVRLQLCYRLLKLHTGKLLFILQNPVYISLPEAFLPL